MHQKELIEKYKEIKDEYQIRYFQPYRHFLMEKKFFAKLQDGTADEFNFFTETIVTYNETTKPLKEPDFISSSGSCYWYSEEGVVRGSNHWGNGVARCDWALHMNNGKTVYGYDHDCSTHLNHYRYGFARWVDFLFKARLITINDEEVLTTFNNTVGWDLIQHNGKVYHRVISESFEEAEAN